jgi:hypothetical protein
MRRFIGTPLLLFGLMSFPVAGQLAFPLPVEGQGSSYVVLMVTAMDGAVSHKALAEKEQEPFKKSLEEQYQKARKAYQDEKKSFQKENPGQKFEKAEPQKPRSKVVKRDIKTLNEAQKTALELDRKKAGDSSKDKNGKSQKGQKSAKEPREPK